jgi:hypothetical protein
VELRVLFLLFRIFDPRRWRTRLKQVGFSVGWLAWIWVRAVQRAERDRIVADAKHIERAVGIREENLAREARKLAP